MAMSVDLHTSSNHGETRFETQFYPSSSECTSFATFRLIVGGNTVNVFIRPDQLEAARMAADILNDAFNAKPAEEEIDPAAQALAQLMTDDDGMPF